MTPALSVLDLALVSQAHGPAATFAASVALARATEELGYTRYWFAEHHNMASIASSAPAVLVAHIAAHTQRIRVGSGGIMLPNHSPLAIAEQFGTLATLHPGRIDLGIGRAPGGDQRVFAALRRDPAAAEHFPSDVRELQDLLGSSRDERAVRAVPGHGTNVPLYILGSSLFGAQLAARFGLPYAFASHFAPDALEAAVEIYREDFRPSASCPRPYVIAGLNVIVADSNEEAERLFHESWRRISRSLAKLSDAETVDDESLLRSMAGQHARHMLTYAAVGDKVSVEKQLERFVNLSRSDEVMVVTNLLDSAARLRSYQLLAEAVGLASELR